MGVAFTCVIVIVAQDAASFLGPGSVLVLVWACQELPLSRMESDAVWTSSQKLRRVLFRGPYSDCGAGHMQPSTYDKGGGDVEDTMVAYLLHEQQLVPPARGSSDAAA
ncbi:hypothetical protein F5Y12DRAFT_715621 [Xylaria sp. FL1777]|nr:hypothetical protein F5Y12DRAFT_715621 [Xylaria sp. FL1777]